MNLPRATAQIILGVGTDFHLEAVEPSRNCFLGQTYNLFVTAAYEVVGDLARWG